MQFHRQLVKVHAPEAGLVGDCFRTCIACLMNLNPEDVPNFSAIDLESGNTQEMDREVRAWLAERGLTLFEFAIAAEDLRIVTTHLAQVNGFNFTYMVGGMGQKHSHIAIYRGDDLLWDPAGGEGITGPVDGFFWIKVLASLRHRYDGVVE